MAKLTLRALAECLGLSPGPATRHVAVTPADSDLTNDFRAIFVGTGGNVSIRDLNNVDVLYKNIASGTVLPVACRRVNSTSTTATDIVGLF